jgi:hypothetical protein
MTRQGVRKRMSGCSNGHQVGRMTKSIEFLTTAGPVGCKWYDNDRKRVLDCSVVMKNRYWVLLLAGADEVNVDSAISGDERSVIPTLGTE